MAKNTTLGEENHPAKQSSLSRENQRATKLVAKNDNPVKTGAGVALSSKDVVALQDENILPKIIFFGNGPLAHHTLTTLQNHCDIVFHARTKSDLEQIPQIKQRFPAAHGILASFGQIIPKNLLELFSPEGIINLHPSKLPAFRGPSPIESAILAGDTAFSYSIMQLTEQMDAGPIFHQATLYDLPLNKSVIYQALATSGTEWLVEHLSDLPQPQPQDNSKATYTTKLNKSLSLLQPKLFPAATILRQIIAYQNYPKPKYTFYGKTCIILEAHLLRTTDILCEAAGIEGRSSPPLLLKCSDRNFVAIDRLQPENKKPMTAQAFVNGYAKRQTK